MDWFLGPLLRLLAKLVDVALDLSEMMDKRLSVIEGRLNEMPTKADFDAAHAEELAEIARIAAKVEELLAKVAGGGLTAAEEDAALADAQSEVAALKAITGEPKV